MPQFWRIFFLLSICFMFVNSFIPSLETKAQGAGWQFLNTSILGEDSRCPLPYDSKASKLDRMFYGVGIILNTSGSCRTESHSRCQGTGHLVVDRDLVVTAAHIFRDFRSKRNDSWKDFVFYIKIWIPEKLRKIPTEAYEFRGYEIRNIYFGTESGFTGHGMDYAFIQLSSSVSEQVEGISIPEEQWIQPLSFRGNHWKTLSNIAMSVGFHWDKDWVPQKNCSPFRLYEFDKNHPFVHPAQRRNLLMHDGDLVENSSGSAITLLNETGNPELVAIAAGQVTSSEKGDFDKETRFNFAIDANGFYQEFVRFRKSVIRERMESNADVDISKMKRYF
ncbi:MAG: hypothetical protein IPJ71_00120 [Bdellovibrionales bacterium]|nr:hypothetical protein [Bdellovibrionales bacterium]